jgi:hypothetical protein
MKLLAALLFAFAGLRSAHGNPPRLFSERSFNAATLAEAVNHYVALGEEAAVKELLSLGQPDDTLGSIDVNERIGWVCRILFEPKGDAPLRPPMFGGLSLPCRTMPLTRWPLYPVVLSGSSYFVLSEGYMLAGEAEPLMNYIGYCRREGVFRSAKIVVPTRRQVLADAALLRGAQAWKDLKWQDSGPNWSYHLSEEGTWKFIQSQAEEVP